VRYGVFLPPFDELADARLLAELAARAEAAGWDGVFLWDHVLYRAPVVAIADPWIALAAMAVATRRIILGALVTPLARRRPWIVARQVTTLDRLAEGRLVLGGGLGTDRSGRELSSFGEELDDRRRAAMLDEALALIQQLLTGEDVSYHGHHYVADGVRMRPRPYGDRIVPVWMAAVWPHLKPVRRALDYQGLFLIGTDRPADVAKVAEIVSQERTRTDGFELVVEGGPEDDPAPMEASGATWWLVGFEPFTLERSAVEAAIDRGPPLSSPISEHPSGR
jgi:alkanesulfonate monooxygenase SsuD/methylene tetrahydromethanopterin reductase-like flavin-dependent oxidoreductase (luciferase family)